MINDTLDAVNLILRKLGEPPIGSLDTQYPTLDLILPALEEARVDLLSEGWWFNIFEPVTLSPDSSGHVTVPPDTLAFYPTDTKYLFTGVYIRQRDGSMQIDEHVEGRRLALIDFELLPSAARTAITYAAAVRVYASDVGVDNIHQSLSMEYTRAYQELSAMHTRQRQYNSRSKKQYRRWKRMLYT